MLHMHRVKGVDILRLLPSCHFHLTQCDRCAHDMVVMLWLCHVMHCVVHIAHKTEHQTFVGWMDFNAIMTMFIGHRADVGDFPIDIGTRKRLLFTVYLFINGTFNDVLGKTKAHERQ